MRTFLRKLAVFLFLAFFLIVGFLMLSSTKMWRMPIAKLTKSSEYAEGNVGAREIIPYIEKVQKKDACTKLIIGDSVCNQVLNRFQEGNEEFCICGTNRAITLAGQYILAEEFVKNHEDVTDIYLVIILDSLTTEFDRQFGYQYVVMPFTETDTIKNLMPSTRSQLRRIYGPLFCWKPVVEVIETSPLNRKLFLNFLTYKEKVFPVGSETVVSEVSYQYLEKLYRLCGENNIQLHLIPGPHADTEAQRLQKDRIERELKENGAIKYFGGYFDEIEYYPVELFRDGVHFNEDVTGEDFFEKIVSDMRIPELNVDKSLRGEC